MTADGGWIFTYLHKNFGEFKRLDKVSAILIPHAALFGATCCVNLTVLYKMAAGRPCDRRDQKNIMNM